MSERMSVNEVVELTGISKSTLYNLMDTGQADLGAVIRSKGKNTYVFFRPKVERFVQGECDISQYKEMVASVKMMNYLLTHAINSLPEGPQILRSVAAVAAGDGECMN